MKGLLSEGDKQCGMNERSQLYDIVNRLFKRLPQQYFAQKDIQ